MMSTFMTTCIAMETELAAKNRKITYLEIGSAAKDRRISELEFLYEDAIAKLGAKTKIKSKNLPCACGGVTSSTPSVAKQHEQTQIHQKMMCQFIEDEDSESVISVSGSEASVFDNDESVLAPNDDEFIRVKRYTQSELPESSSVQSNSYDEEEEEEVFQDASAKAPTKYNKARYESASRECLCGGRTSSIKSRAKIHENSVNHQKYLACYGLSSID